MTDKPTLDEWAFGNAVGGGKTFTLISHVPTYRFFDELTTMTDEAWAYVKGLTLAVESEPGFCLSLSRMEHITRLGARQ